MDSDSESTNPARSEVAKISACIVCRNEGDRLGPCLASVDWVDEIMLLDLSSSDDSIAVAERYGARVIRRDPAPVVEMVRNEVASLASWDWILVLDPDERVTPGLAQELRKASENAELAAVVMPRMNYDLGYPPSGPVHRYEPQLRMYRRSRVKWPTIPNAFPNVPAEFTYRVPARDELVLVHDRSRTISEVLDRSVRYAPIQAQSMVEHGQVFTARAMFLALSRCAHKEFIVAQPWRDGVPGMLRASLLLGFKFYVWAAFWQLSSGQRTAEDDRFVGRLGIGLSAIGRAWRMLRAVKRVFASSRVPPEPPRSNPV